MAYKITQHRRGTYEEWLALDVAPYEGELIIVEFDNNIRKCKIGDGKTLFSDLPYITDWVLEELNDKIDTLQELTGSALTRATTELYQKIEDLTLEHTAAIANLRSDIATQLTDITSNISVLSEDLSKVDGVVKTLVEPAVGELDAKYSEELSQIAEQHNTDRKELYQAIESKSSEILISVDKTIEQSIKEVAEALDTAKVELTADYTKKIADIEEAFTTSTAVSNQVLLQQEEALGAIQNELTEVSASIDEKIEARITTSEANTDTSIQEILESLAQINLTLEQIQSEPEEVVEETPAIFAVRNNVTSSTDDITGIIEQLEDLQYKVALLEAGDSVTATDIQNINIELSRLAASITNLSNQQKAGLNNLSATITTLETKLSKADSDTHAAIASHVSMLNDELAKLTAADTLLYQVIYKIQDTLIKKIETADVALHACLLYTSPSPRDPKTSRMPSSA